jgi:nitrogen fixation NifU-like protein
MSDLRDLYQEVILDHRRSPRNFRAPADATHSAEGYNPLCGDQLTVYLKVEGDNATIVDAAFQGQGCAISTAAASTMTEAVMGRTKTDVDALFGAYHGLVTGRHCALEAPMDLDKLAVFEGVSEFPMRVKCATLCWHTLQAALKGKEQVTTE